MDGVRLAARTVEHELKNALVPAIGYAELLAHSPELSPRLRGMAQEIRDSTQRAADRLDRLLELKHVNLIDWGQGITTIDLGESGSGRSG